MNDHIPAEYFAAYIDGRLSPEKKNELESHFSLCPACLDELLEIAEITRSWAKIPAQFIKQALGEKNKVTKSVLHLRLVFEIAAIFMVVVFIGYLFISNNRFWQTPEVQKPSVMMEKNLRSADTSTVVRDREIVQLPGQRRDLTDAKKTNGELTKVDAGQNISESFASEKRESAVGDKGLPTASGKSMPSREPGNKLQEIAEEKPRPAAEKESLPKNELAQAAAPPEAVDAVKLAFAAKDQTAAKVTETKTGEARQNLEMQKKSGAGAALPIKAKQEKSKDEEFLLRSSVAAPVTIAADQSAFPPVRIEGDVVWTDLRNPELILAWSWFQKGLALELRIDGAGTVIAVVPLGKIDPLSASQAKNEAKKLLFSVSKKKARRARLVANEKPPSPR